jgi:hypothetical protein
MEGNRLDGAGICVGTDLCRGAFVRPEERSDEFNAVGRIEFFLTPR